MVRTLNLYLDSELSYGWWAASLIAEKAAGHGVNLACNVRRWIHAYLGTGRLPVHNYGRFCSSILEDEDLAQVIQLHLQEISKDNYIHAQDIVDFMNTPEMKDYMGTKHTSISVRTARRWLRKLDWRYQKKKAGMYVDSHEREDVVAY